VNGGKVKMPFIQEVTKLYHIVERLVLAASTASVRQPGRARTGASRPAQTGGDRPSRWQRLASRAAIFFAACLLAACSGLSLPGRDDAGDSDKSYAKLLGDMPLPRGARIVGDNSLILGGGADWTGRIAVVADLGWADTFAFFRDQYPALGWELLSSLQARNSILVFVKGERTATIEISPASVLGTKSSVLMTVAPKADGNRAKKPK
jgi:hypothetical protein